MSWWCLMFYFRIVILSCLLYSSSLIAESGQFVRSSAYTFSYKDGLYVCSPDKSIIMDDMVICDDWVRPIQFLNMLVPNAEISGFSRVITTINNQNGHIDIYYVKKRPLILAIISRMNFSLSWLSWIHFFCLWNRKFIW